MFHLHIDTELDQNTTLSSQQWQVKWELVCYLQFITVLWPCISISDKLGNLFHSILELSVNALIFIMEKILTLALRTRHINSRHDTCVNIILVILISENLALLSKMYLKS